MGWIYFVGFLEFVRGNLAKKRKRMGGVPENDESRMEGWLYLIRSNRFGLQYSRKRYFVLQDHLLKSFKSIPPAHDEVC